MKFDPYDINFLPPEEFVPRPDPGSIFDLTIAVGWDKAAMVVFAPQEFLEWERDKEGSVCNPETFQDLPTAPGLYKCEILFLIETDLSEEAEALYAYSYQCQKFSRLV